MAPNIDRIPFSCKNLNHSTNGRNETVAHMLADRRSKHNLASSNQAAGALCTRDCRPCETKNQKASTFAGERLGRQAGRSGNLQQRLRLDLTRANLAAQKASRKMANGNNRAGPNQQRAKTTRSTSNRAGPNQ
jgi:hypothetical protein